MLFPAPSKRAFLIALPRWRIKFRHFGQRSPEAEPPAAKPSQSPSHHSPGTGSIRAGLMNTVAGATQAANNRSASKVIPDLLRSA